LTKPVKILNAPPTIKNKPKNLKNFWWWYLGKKHPNAHLDLFYALKVVQDIIFFRYKQYPKICKCIF
jgi:hypothetical protein